MTSLKQIFIILLISPIIASACTTFCLKFKDQLIFGKNYDWNVDVGLIFINKQSIKKTSFKDDNGKQVSWVSKYGSITFNQYGREFPSGGINEAGLVIELMWLDDTEYPLDDRPAIDCLQWIQYQLDQSKNLADIITHNKKIRINSSGKIHFLVTDALGNSHAVEFLNGEIITNKTTALANSTFKKSNHYAKQQITNPYSKSSLDRFATAQKMVDTYSNQDLIPYGFQILDQVAQGRSTKWSIVYDVKNKNIHFRTQRFRSIKSIQLADFDFNPESTVLMYDMNQDHKANIHKQFIPYQFELDKKIITTAIRQTRFIANTPAHVIHEWASYAQNYTSPIKYP